jgi:hypothetical protein
VCIAHHSFRQLTDDTLKVLRDTYVYRSYLAQVVDFALGMRHTVQGKLSVIKTEIRADAPPELQAIKNAAIFLQTPSQRYSIFGHR